MLILLACLVVLALTCTTALSERLSFFDVDEDDAVDQSQDQSGTADNVSARAATDSANTYKLLHGVLVQNYAALNLARTGPNGVKELIVTLKAGVTDDALNELCPTLQGVCVQVGTPTKHGISFLVVHATVGLLETWLLRLGYDKLKSYIETIEPNLPVTPIPLLPGQHAQSRGVAATASWGLDRIGARATNGASGKGVHIYVIDSGIRATHGEFISDDGSTRVIPTLRIENGAKRVCKSKEFSCVQDPTGHGTHIAGIIGGNTFGIARGASLHAIALVDNDVRSVITAIGWVIQNAETPAIISMSLGMDESLPSRVSPAWDKAVDDAVDAGIVVSVAAGHGHGADACRFSPGRAKSVLTVAASTNIDWPADFSSRGECIDMFAPGVDILSASGRTNGGDATDSGTSVACPHVSGVVGLLLGKHPTLTPSEVKMRLQSASSQRVMVNLLSGEPDMLLDVPRLFISPSCPIFSYSGRPDQSADCFCAKYSLCYDMESHGPCAMAKGGKSSQKFDVRCKTCKCKSASLVRENGQIIVAGVTKVL